MKLLKTIRRKWLIRRFEKHMHHATFGGTRRAGVTQAQVYRAALMWRNRLKRKNSTLEMRKHRQKLWGESSPEEIIESIERAFEDMKKPRKLNPLRPFGVYDATTDTVYLAQWEFNFLKENNLLPKDCKVKRKVERVQ